MPAPRAVRRCVRNLDRAAWIDRRSARAAWIGSALLAGLAMAPGVHGATSPDSPSILGVWRTQSDGGATVHLTPCGEAVCGRVVTSPKIQANPDQRDVRNRDAALRDRPLKGLLMLKLRPTGPQLWGDGWVYNPEDGGTYRGRAELQPDGTLRLRGCIVAPLCRTQVWTRDTGPSAPATAR